MGNLNATDEAENTTDAARDELKKMGQLIASISQEFSDWDIEVVESHEKNVEVSAKFSSNSSKPKRKELSFLAIQTATRTLLSRTTEVTFHYRIPHSKSGEAEIHFSHTGSFSRTGIKAKVIRGGSEAQAISDRFTADEMFYAAFFPLDSKHFHLIQDEQGWLIKTGQMGAAWLAIKFPPTKKYIPMGADQTEALINCFVAANKILG